MVAEKKKGAAGKAEKEKRKMMKEFGEWVLMRQRVVLVKFLAMDGREER